MLKWFMSILILPFNVAVIIPALILYFSNYNYRAPDTIFLIAGICVLIAGLFLTIWTMVLFNNVGKGTLAPWNPPENLVVEGPYRYVRNPMIIGILMILFSEYWLLDAVQILLWAVLFFIINNIHFLEFFHRLNLIKNKRKYIFFHHRNIVNFHHFAFPL